MDAPRQGFPELGPAQALDSRGAEVRGHPLAASQRPGLEAGAQCV